MNQKMIILKIMIFLSLNIEIKKVTNKPEFKKWYESAKKYANKENKRRSKAYVQNYSLGTDYNLLTIEYCDN